MKLTTLVSAHTDYVTQQPARIRASILRGTPIADSFRYCTDYALVASAYAALDISLLTFFSYMSAEGSLHPAVGLALSLYTQAFVGGAAIYFANQAEDQKFIHKMKKAKQTRLQLEQITSRLLDQHSLDNTRH